ncbi:MAG TPA: DUF4038 domain-containing protein [Polyangiaceae bacterium]
MACVQLDVTAGSPRAARTTTVPAGNNWSARGRSKITSYENFGDIISLENGLNELLLLEFTSAGELYIGSQDDGAFSSVNFWTNSYAGWFDWYIISDATGVHVGYRQAGGAWQTPSSAASVAFTVAQLRLGASTNYQSDSNGQIRYGVICVWNTSRPGGAADLAAARVVLQNECDSRALTTTTGSIFYNDCDTASTFGTDGSAAAANLTVTGTPTDNADDPGFAQILTPAALSNAAGFGAPTVSTASGDQSLTPAALAGTAGFGAPTLNLALAAAALVGLASILTPSVSNGQTLAPAALPCSAGFGFPAVDDATKVLRVHSSNRYLADGNGTPVGLWGDAPWYYTIQSPANRATYAADRASRGFTAFIVNGAVSDKPNTTNPTNYNGDPPFNTGSRGSYDLTTPNTAYWDEIEDAIEELHNIGVPMMTPLYLGFEGGTQGFYSDMVHATNSQADRIAFGEYIGNRFKRFGRLIFILGGDYIPNSAGLAAMADIRQGIQNVDRPGRVYTYHAGPNEQSWQVDDVTTGYVAAIEAQRGSKFVNALYAYEDEFGTYHAHSAFIDGFARSPTRMCFGFEGHYRGSGSANADADLLRRQEYAGPSNNFGDEDVWDDFDLTKIDDQPHIEAAHAATFFKSRAWHLLLPSTGTGLVTSGGGTIDTDTYKPRWLASDSSWGYVHLTAGTTVTCNMALFASAPNGASAGVRARYYDPGNGTYQTATGSPFTASGTRTFVASTAVGNNSQGRADWILVLETEFSQSLTATALAGAAAFGVPLVSTVQSLSTTALAGTAGFGAPVLSTLTPLATAALAGTAGFGAPTVTPGAVNLGPAALAGAAAFGAPVVTGGTVLAPAALAGAAAFGSPTLTLFLLPTGFVGSAVLLTPTVTPGAVALAPAALSGAAAFGNHVVTRENELALAAPALAGVAGFGAPSLTTAVGLAAVAVPGAAGFGVPALGLALAPAAFPSSAAFGAPTVTTGPAGLVPVAFVGAAGFGTPTVTPGAVNASPPAVVGSAAFGAPVLDYSTSVQPAALAGAAGFGVPVVVLGDPVLRPQALVALAGFGAATVAREFNLPTGPFVSLGFVRVGFYFTSIERTE